MSYAANRLYVGDLPNCVDKEFIHDFFADCGKIIGIKIKRSKLRKMSYAFITFETHEGAEKAISEYNYTKLDHVPIRISWADSETKRIQQSGLGNLKIDGLDKTIEASQLHEVFSSFGEVISCYIPLINGESRGCGYVQFRNPEDAQRAKEELADATINGKQIHITDYVKPKKENTHK